MTVSVKKRPGHGSLTRPARAAAPPVSAYSSRILEGLARTTRYVDPDVAGRWRDLVGSEIAGLARPGRLSGGAMGRTLEVLVEHGSAAARVAVEEAAILARLAEYFGPGAIARLAIRQSESRPENGSPPEGAGGLSRFRQG